MRKINYKRLTVMLVLSLLMVVGRLEIFPVLVLFSRTTWSKG